MTVGGDQDIEFTLKAKSNGSKPPKPDDPGKLLTYLAIAGSVAGCVMFLAIYICCCYAKKRA